MFDLLKKTAFAAAVIVAPVAANATTVNMVPTFSNVGTPDPTAEFDLSNNTIDNFRFDNNYFAGADKTGALFGFRFVADEADLPQPVFTSFTLNLLGEFSGFEAVWSDDNVKDAADLFFSTPVIFNGTGSTVLTTTFASVPKYLIVSYDSVSTGGDLDIRVAAVPLPAGGLLLIGALGGLAALRRRKKAA